MNVLGISCHYHDSAACLVTDGEVRAAAQEERFTRRKHTGEFPAHAVNFCVQAGGISFAQLDRVVFYEKPFLKFARVLETHAANFPFTLPSFVRSMPEWLGERLQVPVTLKEEHGIEAPVHFVKHHLSHAAASYYTSPFPEAALLTLDGVGEFATSTIGRARGKELTILEELRFPHSLGLFYGAVTAFLGFSANGGEGKTMGLAAYGDPARFRPLLREMVELDEDGTFRLGRGWFAFEGGARMWGPRFLAHFGRPRVEGDFTPVHQDLAAAAQERLEECLLKVAWRVRAKTGAKNLCYGGGVALNCVANQKLRDSGIFEAVHIQPAAGDAGGAVGAALYGYHNLFSGSAPAKAANSVLWGPEFREREVLMEVRRHGLAHEVLGSDAALLSAVAEAIAAGGVVGWFQGRMEFGPRALGARSILADPRSPTMKDHLNLRVKRREKFRPFAPVVRLEDAPTYFESPRESPYMLFSSRIRAEFLPRLPAVAHVDGSARVQTVTEAQNPLLYGLLGELGRVTGIPIVLNTSFNLDGEPIVCEPAHAVKTFRGSELTHLVLGRVLLRKA